jgi:class I fructose-bisphosphate aldolase
MPPIVWAYPRGEAIEAKGGRDSLYAVDYATRVANELGADMVKVNIPEYDKEKSQLYPESYKSLRLNTKEALEKVVKSAGRTIVLVFGGENNGGQGTLRKGQNLF